MHCIFPRDHLLKEFCLRNQIASFKLFKIFVWISPNNNSTGIIYGLDFVKSDFSIYTSYIKLEKEIFANINILLLINLDDTFTARHRMIQIDQELILVLKFCSALKILFSYGFIVILIFVFCLCCFIEPTVSNC